MAASDTPLARTVLDRLLAIYGSAADPAAAGPMRAYMRDAFPFLGLPSAKRRELAKRIVAGLPRPTEADLRGIALACWELPEREYQYFAIDLLVAHPSACGPTFLTTAELLITTRAWWDTVDALATRVVGTIVSRHPAAVATMDRWIVDGDLWLARTAILHQLHYKRATDTERLFRYCTLQAEHPDFFVRKAIGWALRHYARTDADAVRDFVNQNPQLSSLSVREATKHL